MFHLHKKANRPLQAAAALFLACLLFLTLPCGALAETVSLSDPKVRLEIPDGYTVLLPDNLKENGEFLDKLGHTAKSFKNYMEERNMLLVAATDDNTRQIQLKTWETNFSREIGDLSSLDSQELDRAADTLLAQEADESLLSWGRVTRSGVAYLKSTAKVTEQQADFCYIQYVTVRDGRYFALVYYNFGGELTQEQEAEADALLSSLVLPEKEKSFLAGGNYIVQMVIVGALILAAAVIAVLLVVSFVRDIRYRQREDAQTVHIKIKRRKF